MKKEVVFVTGNDNKLMEMDAIIGDFIFLKSANIICNDMP